MDKASIRSLQEINSFLQSIPDLEKEVGNDEDRNKMFQAVRLSVKHRLAKVYEDEDWLLAIIRHNYGDEEDLDFAANFLLQYFLDRPWVLEEEFVKNLATFLQGCASSSLKPSFVPEKHRKNCAHMMFSNFAETEPISSTGRRRLWALDSASQPSEIDGQYSELLAHSDVMLGIAGFSPLSGQTINITGECTQELHKDCINELRSHLWIRNAEGTNRNSCSISFTSIRGSQDMDAENSAKDLVRSIIARISCALYAIDSTLSGLQDKGFCCNGVTFLRYPQKSKEGRAHRFVKTCFMESETVGELLIAFQLSVDDLIKDSMVKLKEDGIRTAEQARIFIGTKRPQWRPPRPSRENLAAGSGISLLLMGAATILTGGAALPIVATHGALLTATASFLWARHSFSRECPPLVRLDAVVQKLLILAGTTSLLEDERMGVEPGDGSTLLHRVALAVQFVALAVQSFMRGAVTPINFIHLDVGVTDFRLHGAAFTELGDNIVARSQKLSCLGEMLGQQALVFGTPPDLDSPKESLDVVTTSTELLDLWGPGRVLISAQNEPETMSEIAISIGGGVILPTGRKRANGLEEWHWNRLQDDVKPNLLFTIRQPDATQKPVGGNRLIQIGANQSHAIGPAILNPNCPHSNNSSDLALRAKLHYCLSDIASQDGSSEVKVKEISFQGGQWLVPQVVFDIKRSPGTTLKSSLLNPNDGFNLRIAQLDKPCGLFVSLCTGVMVRVKLRHLIAFTGSRLLSDLVPTLPQSNHEQSLSRFVEAFEGSDNLKEWLNAQLDLLPQESQQRELQEAFMKLIDAVLQNLQQTGVHRNDHLAIGWISEGQAIDKLAIPCRKNAWLKVLADSSQTATFACVSPCCWEALSYRCKGNNLELPKDFRLSTKVGRYRQYFDGKHATQTSPLKIGAEYWVNPKDLSLSAVVKERVESESAYILTIKTSVLPSMLSKHFSRKEIIREEDHAGSFRCLIRDDYRSL